MIGVKGVLGIVGVGAALVVGYLLLSRGKDIGNWIGSTVGGGIGGGIAGIGQGFSDAWNAAFAGLNLGGSTAGGQTTPNNPNTENDILVQSGNKDKIVNNDVPIALSFKEFLENKSITKDFAVKYSFQPPAKEGQLDVSNAFQYLSEGRGTYGGKLSTQYGGYKNEQAQNNALASAIQESATKYPEWFA